MTPAEFSDGFDQLVNSYSRFKSFDNRETFDSIEFNEYQKSLFLTKAQEELIESLYSGEALEGESYEDVIRNCISIGGDSDTIAAIAGGIAEAFYGVPEKYQIRAERYLPPALMQIVLDFQDWLKKR